MTPRGIRNNNPLNIRRTGKDQWKGMVKPAVVGDKAVVVKPAVVGDKAVAAVVGDKAVVVKPAVVGDKAVAAVVGDKAVVVKPAVVGDLKSPTSEVGDFKSPPTNRSEVGDFKSPPTNRPEVGDFKSPPTNRPEIGDFKSPPTNRSEIGDFKSPPTNRSEIGDFKSPPTNRSEVGDFKSPPTNRPEVGDFKSPPTNRPAVWDKEFCQFESMAWGWRAAFYLLTRTYYHKYRLYTIRGIVSKWAPPQDHNNTEAYIRNVCKRTGIGPDEPIGIPSQQPARWMMLGVAMAIQENGTDSLDYFAMLRGWELCRSEN